MVTTTAAVGANRQTEVWPLVDPTRAEALTAAIPSVTDQPVPCVIYRHDHADHATGGGVRADTATFISHRDTVAKIAALNDPNTPAPQIASSDEMSLELGGAAVTLHFTGRNHSDNSIVLLCPGRRLLFAVDFIPVSSLPYRPCQTPILTNGSPPCNGSRTISMLMRW